MNVNGHLAVKLRRPPVISLIKSCHILALQETWLRPEEHNALKKDLPKGYTLISVPRPEKANMNHGYGGVAAIVHESLQYTVRSDLSGSDQLVLEMPSVFVVCSYLPCANSRIDNATWTLVEPVQRLEELITGLRMTGKLVYTVGDMNARTGGLRAADYHPLRASQDMAACNSRGRWLLRAANENKLCILNGAFGADAAQRGRMTSYQMNGNSIVDYALLSDEHLDQVLHFSVEPLLSVSDHAVLHVRLDVAVEHRPRPPRRAPPMYREDIPLSNPQLPIDNMLREVMAEPRSWMDAMIELYGPAQVQDKNPLLVWTDGSCIGAKTRHARAGAGVFWGRNCMRNRALRLPGLVQTNNRAELFAMLVAIDQSDPLRALTLYSDSEYAIRSIAEWAPARADTGWTCVNGDLLSQICVALQRRAARVHLIWVKAHNGNANNDAADALAKQGAQLPAVTSDYVLDTSPVHPAEAAAFGLKVTTSLPPLVKESTGPAIWQRESDLHNEPWFTLQSGERTQNPSLWHMRQRVSHRARALDENERQQNLNRLLTADTPAKFWALMTEWCKPGRVGHDVDGDLLEDAFRVRLSGPVSPPPHFDRNYKDLVDHLIRELPERTIDHSTDQIFSRAITQREVAEAKRRVLEHLHTSKGIDSHSYEDILSLSNARLADLLSTCLLQQLIPTAWKAALLAAVPKAKGPYSDPENYRMIALECCMLKLMTLILEARIRQFAEREHAIPRSQNGFRPSYRTENNAFIVRVAIETAHCEGKPLHVAFVDLRNAFPSVDRSILWSKMLDMGISGPVFDWLRKLYSDMRYFLRRDGGLSHALKADLGILMGDPASPLAFLLYMSDFRTDAHADDIVMMNSVIAHLEHADDLALMSTSPEGLQAKLDTLAAWASRNQMEVNTSKTVVMIFKPPRRKNDGHPPQFSIYGHTLNIVDKYKYVGVLLCSSQSNLWDSLTDTCARSARRASNMCFFVESRTGQLPPWEGRMLYNAQLDSRLTHAVEVTGVGTLKQLEQLETVQLLFLRRLLGLQSRSQKCVLYTETGVWPLKFRRLHLTLGYLMYLLRLEGTHYAQLALRQSMSNSVYRRSGWWHDLCDQLERLGLQLPPDCTADSVEALRTSVRKTMLSQIADECNTSPKLQLLRNRKEYDVDGRDSSQVLAFRQYLLIKNKAARQALTRMLLSDHRLAVETGRWEGVERTLRKCRLCNAAVEEPEHVLFKCVANASLCERRSQFWEELEAVYADRATRCKAPSLKACPDGRATCLRLQLMSPSRCIFAILCDITAAGTLAVFTHRAFLLFDSLPPRRYRQQDEQ